MIFINFRFYSYVIKRIILSISVVEKCENLKITFILDKLVNLDVEKELFWRFFSSKKQKWEESASDSTAQEGR